MRLTAAMLISVAVSSFDQIQIALNPFQMVSQWPLIYCECLVYYCLPQTIHAFHYYDYCIYAVENEHMLHFDDCVYYHYYSQYPIQTSDLPVPTNSLFQAPIMVQCHLQTSVKDFFSETAKAMLIEPLHNSENDGLMTYVCELGVSLTLMKLRLEQLGGGLRLSIKPDQTLDFLLDLPFEKVHLAPTLAVKTAPLSGHIHLVKSEQFDGHSYQNTILVHILSNMGLIVSQSTSLVNQEDATKADLILLANHNPIAAMLTLPELHKDQDEYDIPTEALIPLPAIITFATLRTFLGSFSRSFLYEP